MRSVRSFVSNDILRGLPRKDLWMLQYALDASEMEDPFEYSKELDPEVLEADGILVCVCVSPVRGCSMLIAGDRMAESEITRTGDAGTGRDDFPT